MDLVNAIEGISLKPGVERIDLPVCEESSYPVKPGHLRDYHDLHRSNLSCIQKLNLMGIASKKICDHFRNYAGGNCKSINQGSTNN